MRSRTVLRLVTGSLAVVCALVTAAPTHAARPTEAVGSQVLAPTIELASQSPVVRPGEDLVLRVAIDGVEPSEPAAPADPSDEEAPADDTAEGPTVTIRVHERLTSRSAFALTLEGRGLGQVISTTTAPLAELGEDPAGARVIRLPVRDEAGVEGALVLRREGVFPTEIRVDDGDRSAQLVTHVIRAPSVEIPPLALALIVPLHAPPALTSDGAVALGERARLHLEETVDTLATVARVPVVVAPTPDTLVALDQIAPATANRLADRVATDHLMVRPWVLPDPRVTDAERIADLLRVGADVTADRLGARPGIRTWLADTPLDRDALSALRSVGVDQLVATTEQLELPDLALTLTDLVEVLGARGEPLRVAVADDAIADRLTDGDDPVLAAHQALADLAVLLFDEPGRARGVVVVFDELPAARTLDVLLGALSSSPIAQPVDLETFFQRVGVATTAGRPVVAEPIEAPLPLTTDDTSLRTRLAALATMVASDTDVVESFERRLLTALARDLPGALGTYVAEVSDLLTAELDRIATPSDGSFTLTARTGELPITLRNDTDYSVEVAVSLDSDKLGFPDGAERQIRLDPGNTTTRFLVEARASGTFPLLVSVTSPDGTLDLGTSRYRVRSTVVSGVGLALTIGSLLFLVVWWGTHLRRGPAEIVLDDEPDGSDDDG